MQTGQARKDFGVADVLRNMGLGEAEPASSPATSQPTKGQQIKAKIDANRSLRLSHADRMKAEAGVTDHQLNERDLGGIAYIGTGRILSPQGRNIVELMTVAHECGHIFLHSDGDGRQLPSHVMEWEAECYAHQCLRELNMEVPKWRTQFGRNYVAQCITRDRLQRLPIDPRVEDYARKAASPYEPLRLIPREWKLHNAVPWSAEQWQAALAQPPPPVPVRKARQKPEPFDARLARWLGALRGRGRAVAAGQVGEFNGTMWPFARWALWSYLAGNVAYHFMREPLAAGGYVIKGEYTHTISEAVAILALGLLVLNARVLLATMTRPHGGYRARLASS